MPSIDVSDVLFDPDLADRFDVIRRSEVVDNNGRSVLSEQKFPGIIGSIQTTGDGSLQRRDDGQMMPRSVSVVTVFRLRGPSEGFQPDQIFFEGVRFTIVEILPFCRFGRGFVEAVAISMNASNPPPL